MALVYYWYDLAWYYVFLFYPTLQVVKNIIKLIISSFLSLVNIIKTLVKKHLYKIAVQMNALLLILTNK